jgi:hypothetical protein
MPIKKQISKEKKELEEAAKQVERSIEQELVKAYGFCADPSKSPFQNAIKIRENTIAWIYHSNPSNLAFHDLTPNKSLPAIAKEVLGCNLKFIPTPQVTTGELGQYFTRLTRDTQLKTFFATEEATAEDIRFEQENRPKLYLN